MERNGEVDGSSRETTRLRLVGVGGFQAGQPSTVSDPWARFRSKRDWEWGFVSELTSGFGIIFGAFGRGSPLDVPGCAVS